MCSQIEAKDRVSEFDIAFRHGLDDVLWRKVRIPGRGRFWMGRIVVEMLSGLPGGAVHAMQ